VNEVPWVKLKNVKVGDAIHRWGDWLPIVAVQAQGKKVRIEYMDGNKRKDITDWAEHEYIIRKAK